MLRQDDEVNQRLRVAAILKTRGHRASRVSTSRPRTRPAHPHLGQDDGPPPPSWGGDVTCTRPHLQRWDRLKAPRPRVLPALASLPAGNLRVLPPALPLEPGASSDQTRTVPPCREPFGRGLFTTRISNLRVTKPGQRQPQCRHSQLSLLLEDGV